MYIDKQTYYDEICESRKNNRFTDEAYRMTEEIVGLNIRRCYRPGIMSRCATSFVIAETEKHLHSFRPELSSKPNSAFNYLSEVSKRALLKFQLKTKPK